MRPDILINRMKELNVDSNLISVVKSFLSDRQQSVAYHGEKSSYQNVKIGVPQGTLLGPILWNIFVDSLKPQARYIKYADDTTIYDTICKSDVHEINTSRNQTTLDFDDSRRLQTAADYAQ